jgi:hypothetical protein
MTDDHREAGTVYPRFSVRFVTWRMIIETGTVYPRFQWSSLHDDYHREAGTVYPMFSVRFVTWRMIIGMKRPALYYHVSHTHQYVFVFLLVSVPRLYSAVDLGFKPRLGQTKGYTIGSCCFSAQHAAWMRKSEEWLGRNQNNIFEWSDMYIHGLVSVSLHYTNSTMRVGLVQSGSLHRLIEN